MPRYPFSPALLDTMPEELAELYRGLERTLLDEICGRLKISGQLNEVTVQDIRALRAHGIDLEGIKKAISDANGTGMNQLDALLNDVAARNQAYYTELIDLARVTAPEQLVSAADIAAIRRQTWGAYRNITGSMGFLVRQGGRMTFLEPAKAYQWALDSAALQVQSGAFSYNQAIAGAVRQLADSGLCVAYDKNGNPLKNRVAYESGHIDHLDVAVRRAVMTATVQISSKYREQSVDYLETDLVECTAHLGARNTGEGPANHAAWQGGVYRWSEKPRTSKGSYKDFVNTTGYGTGEGLCGWNCRHNFYPFVEGVSERTYTDEELEAMKPENRPKIQFEGREYDDYQAAQKQRQLERTIRKQKRLKTAYESAGLDNEAQAASIRLRRLNEKYHQFSQAAGLPEQRERMRVLEAAEEPKHRAKHSLGDFAKQEKSAIITNQENPPKRILTAAEAIERAKQFADSHDYLGVSSLQELRAITNAKLGYDRLPQVLNSDEFEKAAEGKVRFYRGVHSGGGKSADEIAEEFKYGKLWTGNTGGAVYGNGSYFTASEETAKGIYAKGDGAIIEMILCDDAKVADFKTIYQDFFDTGIPKVLRGKELYQLIISDVGQYAAVKGYDAIALNGFHGHDYLVLLNRTAAIVKE